MSEFDNIVDLPHNFDGRVRLFPLPELVVFPHAMQPLHIFEPRYCAMVEQSLATDRLIAMATLLPGPITDPPQISPHICIGKIITHAETDERRHNILLVGAKRATVSRELVAGTPFRVAEVVLNVETQSLDDPEKQRSLRRALLDAFAAIIPSSTNVQQGFYELMAGTMGLGPITDIIAFALGLPANVKLRLLAESDVDRRAGQLIRLLREMATGGAGIGAKESARRSPGEFPPPFSLN